MKNNEIEKKEEVMTLKKDIKKTAKLLGRDKEEISQIVDSKQEQEKILQYIERITSVEEAEETYSTILFGFYGSEAEKLALERWNNLSTKTAQET